MPAGARLLAAEKGEMAAPWRKLAQQGLRGMLGWDRRGLAGLLLTQVDCEAGVSVRAVSWPGHGGVCPGGVPHPPNTKPNCCLSLIRCACPIRSMTITPGHAPELGQPCITFPWLLGVTPRALSRQPRLPSPSSPCCPFAASVVPLGRSAQHQGRKGEYLRASAVLLGPDQQCSAPLPG